MPYRANPQEAVDLLSRLVACPSVNPGASARLGPPFNEHRLCGLLGELLAGWGAEVHIEELAPERSNLVARFAGETPSRTLMLEAHADTVPAAGMNAAFTPVLRGGRLYGRGACDTKGSMAAMLLAIRALLAERGRLPLTVLFAATADEEIGCTGALALRAGAFRPDACVVGEPTDMAFVTAHKGALRWRIATRGVSAHSSDPSAGINAIYRMQRVLAMIEHELAPELARRPHPVLGPATISVGVIRGGSQVNVVPAECEIEVDRRTLPSEQGDALTDELRRRLAMLSQTEPHFVCELVETQFYPSMELDAAAPLRRIAARAAERTLGAASFTTAPWTSNAGVFHAAGIPSILFGPGSIAQAHTSNESIAIDDVCTAAAVYAALIEEAARELPPAAC